MPKHVAVSKDAIRRMYDAGYSVAYTSKALKVNEIVVRARLQEMGLTPRSRRELTDFYLRKVGLTDKTIIKHYDQGYSVQHIAKQYGISRGVINRRLLDLGLAARTASQAGFIRMGKMTPEQRLKLASKAHAAVRGKRKNEASLINRAIGVQNNAKPSNEEAEILAHLQDAKIQAVPCLAVYKYNLDIGISASRIAIEVHNSWHTAEKKALADAKKLSHLLAGGWMVFYVHALTFDTSMLKCIIYAHKTRRLHLSSRK